MKIRDTVVLVDGIKEKKKKRGSSIREDTAPQPPESGLYRADIPYSTHSF